jgi:hypothetical protein
VRLPQLAKQHGDEPTPARKAPRVALGPVLAHQFLELQARKQLEQLGVDAAYSIHGGTSSGVSLFAQTTTSTYRDSASLQKPNLDKPGFSPALLARLVMMYLDHDFPFCPR